MRESSVPAIVTADPDDNLTDLLVRAARDRGTSVMFSRRVAGVWQDVTAERFEADVVALAKGLVASGVRAGDRVGIMSKTRYEWTLADFAIWSAGAVTVPIYETSSAEQVSWILSDSGAVAIFTETGAHTATVAEVRDTLPALRDVWSIDNGAVDELVEAGRGVDDTEIDGRRRSLRGDSVATIIYTSGTTGRPKGCELTHANFGDLAANAVARLGSVVSAPGASTLLFLPLAHVFARFIQVLAVASGARLGHTADVKNLIEDLGGFRPTFVLAVPRVFEKIYNSAEAKAEAGGKGKIFHAAADTAIAWSQATDAGRVPLTLALRHALFDRLVYSRLRATLGGQVQYAVSGGAPLGTRLGHFFRGVGVTVLEGWGLTETTAPATVNTPEKIKIGTVGLPLPGVTVRVADDGELLVKGVNVLRGYFNNAQATAEAVEDGWFHTGDLGTLDADGWLYFVDRKRDVIRRGGENMSSALIEKTLCEHPAVAEAAVIGVPDPVLGQEVKAFIVARAPVTPDELRAFATERLAKFQVPRLWEFRDNLPKTPTQRVEKYKLRQESGGGDKPLLG